MATSHKLVEFLQFASELFQAGTRLHTYYAELTSHIHQIATDKLNVSRSDVVDRFDTSGEYGPLDYFVCEGEEHGYPCALWMLFHALLSTPAASSGSLTKYEAEGRLNGAVINFVLNFFRCSDCRAHFLGMTAGLDSELAAVPPSLWLWRAHNKVQLRIAREKSNQGLNADSQEPPSTAIAVHASIWPSPSACPDCYCDMGGGKGPAIPLTSGELITVGMSPHLSTYGVYWNETRVLEYLSEAYCTASEDPCRRSLGEAMVHLKAGQRQRIQHSAHACPSVTPTPPPPPPLPPPPFDPPLATDSWLVMCGFAVLFTLAIGGVFFWIYGPPMQREREMIESIVAGAHHDERAARRASAQRRSASGGGAGSSGRTRSFLSSRDFFTSEASGEIDFANLAATDIPEEACDDEEACAVGVELANLRAETTSRPTGATTSITHNPVFDNKCGVNEGEGEPSP